MTAAMRNTANEMAAGLRCASREMEKVITHLAHVDSLLADRTSSIMAERLDPRADVLRLIASCRAIQSDWLAKSGRIERYEKQLVRERGPAASPVAQEGDQR